MSIPDMVEALRSVHFLHDIPEEYLRPLASFTEVQEKSPEGGVLFREGQPHRYIYFVIEGSVALEEFQLSGRTVKRLQTVGAGELLGWSPCWASDMTATARVLEPTRGRVTPTNWSHSASTIPGSATSSCGGRPGAVPAA